METKRLKKSTVFIVERAGWLRGNFMGKGEDHLSGSSHQKRHHLFSGFSFYEGSAYPVTPGSPGSDYEIGAMGKAIPEVTGPGDIRRYNFLFPSFFCGKGFVFLLHDIPWASGYYGSQAASGGYGRIRKGKGISHGDS